MGMYDFDPEETVVPEAFLRKFGNAVVPSSADVRAWQRGLLGASLRARQFDIHGKRLVPVTPYDARDEHPTTHNWTAPWKPKPTGEGLIARHREQFKAGGAKAILAGRRSTLAKRMAARENGRLGGRPRKNKTPGLN